MARANYEKPTPSNVIPTKDEFLAWTENPVTSFVAMAYKIGAELQREDWLKKSWEGGQSDPLTLAICKTREDAYLAFLQSNYEDYLTVIKENY